MMWLRLVRGELRKLTTTKLPWAFLAVLVVMGAITAIAVIAGTDMDGSKGFIATAADQQSLMAFGWNAMMIAGLFGAIAVSREYAHATVVAMFLTAPRRARAVLAQLTAVLLGGAVWGFTGAALTVAAVAAALMVAALGARHVLTAGDDPDPSRLTDTFARFCALAQERALTVDLEFMPWTAVKCARSAQAIVAAAGAANGGILVDALHFDRSATTLEDVRQLPPSRLHYAQLCDAPADFDPTDEGLIAVARGGRLFPGEGGIDLTGLVRALPGDIPLSVEVINTGLFQGMSLLERGRRAMASARRVLMHAESAPA